MSVFSLFSSPTPSYAHIVNSSLACILMFLTGSLFALGIFAVPIENSAHPLGVLDGVWTSTIGLISLISAPITVFTGFFIDGGAIPQTSASSLSFGKCKTQRIRILGILVCLSFACLALVARGIQTSNALLIRMSAATLAFPLGIIYLLSSELLLIWNPLYPGLATGLGQLALSCGCISFSSFYQYLILSIGCVQSFYMLAILFCGLASIPTLLMYWPNQDDIIHRSTPEHNFCEHSSVGLSANIRLPWNRLCRLPSFWLFLFVTFCSAVPCTMVTFFFKIGHVFQQSSTRLLLCFQLSTLLSLIFSVLAICSTEFIRFGSSNFFSGAKIQLAFMFFLQTLAYILFISSSISSNFTLFMASVIFLMMMMAAYAGCSAILARDVFGAANATVVFGIGAGLGMGMGEGLSTMLMSLIESSHGSAVNLVPRSYIYYYAIAASWSFLGLLALLKIGKCGEAFPGLPTSSYASFTSINESNLHKPSPQNLKCGSEWNTTCMASSSL